MGLKSPSDYGNIENRRQEQQEIIKWKERLYFGAAFMFSILILHSFFATTKDIFSASVFFVNWGDTTDTTKFLTKRYIYSSIAILVVIYLLLFSVSKIGMIRAMGALTKRNKNIPFLMKQKFKIVCLLDRILFYLFYPISFFVFNVGDRLNSSIDKFYFRLGWLEHIEYSFFKEVQVKVDGYERVKNLSLFANYKEFFSEERSNAVHTCSTYLTTYKIFLNEKEMDDLIKIVEGYIALDKREKFDKKLTRNEYQEILKRDFDGKIENFKCYNGVNNVYFSHDLIKDFMDQETALFSTYMKKYALSSRQTFTRTYMKNLRIIKKDKKLLKKIADFHLPSVAKIEELSSDSVLTKRIIELCKAYHRLVLFKMIIGKYMNLPAGTMVVKIEDYTARMILEIYDEETLIQIVEGKNDGKSEDFNSDALVNIYLAAYNYYNLSSPYSTIDKAYDIFNFREGEKILENEKEESLVKEFVSFSNEISDGTREPTKEEVAYFNDNLSKK